MVDQLSWAIRARVRQPARLTSSPGRLRPDSDGPRGVRAVSSSCSGGLAPVSDSPGGRQAFTGDSGQCPRARGVEQLSLETRDQVRWHEWSTSIPDRLRPLSMDPRCRPAAPGDSAPVRCPARATNSPGRFALGSEGPRGRPAVPGDSGLGPITRGGDQLPPVTQSLVRGPAGMTSTPGQLAPGSDSPRGRPESWGICARVRVPAVLTSSPRRLGKRSVLLQGRPADPCDSGPFPSARVVDQLSRATQTWF